MPVVLVSNKRLGFRNRLYSGNEAGSERLTVELRLQPALSHASNHALESGNCSVRYGLFAPRGMERFCASEPGEQIRCSLSNVQSGVSSRWPMEADER